MGTHRFRLSDMIPNSWLHKLKCMTRTKNPNANHPRKKIPYPKSSKSTSPTSSSTVISISPPESKTETRHLLSYQRKSYYFRRELTPSPQPPDPKFQRKNSPESPSKSPKQTRHRGTTTTKRRNRGVTSSSVSTCCICRATVESVWTNLNSTSEDYAISPLDSSSDLQPLDIELSSDQGRNNGMVACSSPCYSGVQNDIVIDMNVEKSLSCKLDGFDTEIQLPPIVTKRNTKFTNGIQGTNQKQEQRTSQVLSLRTNSPIITSRKSTSSSCRSWRGLSGSFAVLKSSADPQRDFRESMVEMILENNLRPSKDLKDLLACYLQLNSEEYHEQIVKYLSKSG